MEEVRDGGRARGREEGGGERSSRKGSTVKREEGGREGGSVEDGEGGWEMWREGGI